MTRFGIEEEFLLLDEDSLVPVGMAAGATEHIARPAVGGTVSAEYLTSQIEISTDPVSSAAEAHAQLRGLRALLRRHAEGLQAIAAPTGVPFATARTVVVSPSPHYDRVAANLGHLTHDHEVGGLHVHVEVHDDEERVRALDRVRGWLPALLALTGNSPFAHGRDTGFASWRSILIRRLPTSWCPPRFDDPADYRRGVQRLLDLGAVSEPSSLSWAVRLSERYPTVEVRVFDVQLLPEDAVFAAVLCRAIVRSARFRPVALGVDLIDESLWTAARHGMSARIVDPTTGGIDEAWTVVHRMTAVLAPALRELGDVDLVDEGLARVRDTGTGADRQRGAFAADGTAGLVSLLREAMPRTNEGEPHARARPEVRTRE
jgi:carboxylate-amine ligase